MHGVEERVISFRASRTFIDLHLLLAARMILLRTERDSPAVLTGLCKPGSCRMALLLILSICIWSVKTLKSAVLVLR